jgi:hypothetical protein
MAGRSRGGKYENLNKTREGWVKITFALPGELRDALNLLALQKKSNLSNLLIPQIEELLKSEGVEIKTEVKEPDAKSEPAKAKQ